MKDSLDVFFSEYSLDKEDKDYLSKIMLPIFRHEEFQKRLTNTYLHHGTITLGEHIIKDTIMTYFLSKRYHRKEINLDLALKISMLHDLYTNPWQNSNEHPKFFHKHGFRHPIEACINAAYWFPDYFKDLDDAKIIIDGILHHMFPLPVSSMKKHDIVSTEINNYDKYIELNESIKDIIYQSLTRKKLLAISFSRSIYPEGRIMSKADKKVALSEIKDLSSARALLTGKNKKI